MYMTSQASSKEYSDPFKISPCQSPHRYRHGAIQPSKVQQETAPSLPCPYPVSSRAYNKKDYNYIASFPRATHVEMKLNQSKTELLQLNQSKTELSQCEEIRNESTDDTVMASNMLQPKQAHTSLPEFGAWNVEASSSSVEGYTDVFDRVRERKRGGDLSAQSLPPHFQTPVRGLVKELAVAKIPSRVSTPHRKWTSSSWSRCFVAPVTTE